MSSPETKCKTCEPKCKSKSKCHEHHEFASLHTWKRRTRWTIRILIVLLATGICLYQSYIVCVLYFTYPTNVDIRLDQSPNVHLPAVTICSELSSTMLVDQLHKLSPELSKLFNNRTRSEIRGLHSRTRTRKKLLSVLQSLPINLQHRYTVNSSQFFQECHLPTSILESKNSTKKIINCSDFTPIVESISLKYKCFSLFVNRTNSFSAKLPNASSFEIDKNLVSSFKYLIWIQMNRDYIFNGFIYVHPPDVSHQYSTIKNVQHLSPNRNQFVTIAFDRETIQLLPPPYETNCRDYRTDGYQSRSDCMTKCKVKQYLKLDGWPGDIYAEPNVRVNFSKLWLNSPSTSGHLEEGVSSELLSNCSVECGNQDDCERIQYDVRKASFNERDSEDHDAVHSFKIGILPPEDVQMVIKHVPKFAPIEFFIYVGGLANFYLGYSAISFGAGILTYLSFSTKIQTKYCCIPVRKRRAVKNNKNGSIDQNQNQDENGGQIQMVDIRDE